MTAAPASRFAADYYLFDDISWISYYELGVNIPALFDWDNHYAEGANNTTRRMLYTGLKSDTWGTLTYGQQNSIYYDVVGGENRYLGLRYDRSGPGGTVLMAITMAPIVHVIC